MRGLLRVTKILSHILKSYITNYYKGLFGYPEEGNFSMDETQTNNIPQVSIEENNFLTSLYTEEEVRNVVFQMEHNCRSRWISSRVLSKLWGSNQIRPT
jgi:hypothetical protein